MNIVILTPVRLLGESVAIVLRRRREITAVEIAHDHPTLHRLLLDRPVGVVLVDITQSWEQQSIRTLVESWPDARLLALGLEEESEAVIRCGRAGFSGYVPRDSGIDALCRAVLACSDGCLHCPAEISGRLMRALFQDESQQPPLGPDDALTHRQEHVIDLISRGLSNKEIARELDLSVATVKHHVHNILEKLHVSSRVHVVRRMHGPAAPAGAPPKSRARR